MAYIAPITADKEIELVMVTTDQFEKSENVRFGQEERSTLIKGNQGLVMVSGSKEGLCSWVETKAGSANGHKVAPATGSWGLASSSSEDLMSELEEMVDQKSCQAKLSSSQHDFEWVLRWTISLLEKNYSLFAFNAL